jgi:hypothetical protein
MCYQQCCICVAYLILADLLCARTQFVDIINEPSLDALTIWRLLPAYMAAGGVV